MAKKETYRHLRKIGKYIVNVFSIGLIFGAIYFIYTILMLPERSEKLFSLWETLAISEEVTIEITDSKSKDRAIAFSFSVGGSELLKVLPDRHLFQGIHKGKRSAIFFGYIVLQNGEKTQIIYYPGDELGVDWVFCNEESESKVFLKFICDNLPESKKYLFPNCLNE